MLRGLFSLVALVCIIFIVATAAGFAAKAAVIIYPLVQFARWLDRNTPGFQEWVARGYNRLAHRMHNLIKDWEPFGIPTAYAVLLLVFVVFPLLLTFVIVLVFG